MYLPAGPSSRYPFTFHFLLSVPESIYFYARIPLVHSEKPNAVLTISEHFFRKWLGINQFEQGFIRVVATRFCISENVKFDRFYKVFRRPGKVLRKPSLGNAF